MMTFTKDSYDLDTVVEALRYITKACDWLSRDLYGFDL